MLGALLSLVGVLILRVMVVLGVPKSGISIYVGDSTYAFSKGAILLALWTLLGIPLLLVSLSLIYQHRRSRL